MMIGKELTRAQRRSWLARIDAEGRAWAGHLYNRAKPCLGELPGYEDQSITFDSAEIEARRYLRLDRDRP